MSDACGNMRAASYITLRKRRTVMPRVVQRGVRRFTDIAWHKTLKSDVVITEMNTGREKTDLCRGDHRMNTFFRVIKTFFA